MKNLESYLKDNRKDSYIRFYYDIETLQYNEEEGRKKPSKFRNVIYCFAIGYYIDDVLQINKFPNFKSFVNKVVRVYKKWKRTPKIQLIAHNCNKYDNHFLRYEALFFYNLPVKNLYLMNANQEGNALSVRKKELSSLDKQGVILEKRIKSSNNLEMNFFIHGIEFYTVDNYMKTNSSIKVLGEKLLKYNFINEDDLKTDYNYTKYNKDYDMSDIEAFKYGEKVFESLTPEEHLYIDNDIIILAESVRNYSKIFEGFDYEKITFTSNILSYYNDNDLTSYQLLKSVGQGKDKTHIKYTDYRFSNENFYDYLKSFYGGGLNFYNSNYVGTIINEKLFSMDLNSSYPYAMHQKKMPTFLDDYKEFKVGTEIDIKISDDYFTMYRLTKKDFDDSIIDKIDSLIIRQMLVKYYTKKEYVNINTYTLKILLDILKIDIKTIKVLSYVTFKCEFFGSRNKISEKYHIKTQGSSKNIVSYVDPYTIEMTDIVNDKPFSRGEIDNSKVVLNGLYGIPALRSHFNLFRWVGKELVNVNNGYANNERNISFSIMVTAISLYNLLEPLKFLTQSEIDENFVYCDTDSLYLKKKVYDKMDSTIFDPYILGKWDIEKETIDKFSVLNHKKYAYQSLNDKGKSEITIKSGGIPNDSFDTNMSFEEFVKTQFSDGVEIKNTKSIMNDKGTISIYESTTELQVGKGYRIFSYDPIFEQMREQMIKEINESDGNYHDLLYIESNLGILSLNDIVPVVHENDGKSLLFLKIAEDEIKYNDLQLE